MNTKQAQQEIKKNFEHLKLLANDLVNTFDLLNENTKKYELSKKEQEKLTNELKEARESRNNVIREVYQMKVELEVQKVFFMINFLDLTELLHNK